MASEPYRGPQNFVCDIVNVLPERVKQTGVGSAMTLQNLLSGVIKRSKQAFSQLIAMIS